LWSSLPAHDSPRMTLVAKRNAQQAKQKANREAAPKPPAPKPPAPTPAPQPNLTVLWSCSSVCFHRPLDSGQFFQIPISFRVLQGACGQVCSLSSLKNYGRQCALKPGHDQTEPLIRLQSGRHKKRCGCVRLTSNSTAPIYWA
jgi:hypothetical protein